MVNYYLEVLDNWLETQPFTEAGAAVLPDDPVVQLVNDALLQKLDPNDPNNYIKIRYHDYNSNIYVLCNHQQACRLLIIGYELDENLMDPEEESFPQESEGSKRDEINEC